MYNSKYKIIRSKANYIKLARNGLAGNCPKIWNNFTEFNHDWLNKNIDKNKLKNGVAIRSTIPGGKFIYSINPINLYKVIQTNKFKEGEYYLTIPLPFDECLVAGELSWYNGDWIFYHSFVKDHMRPALKINGKHAIGYYQVWSLINKYSTPSDVEDLKYLFDLYTINEFHPVIEFTITKGDWGIFPNRNTLIWEIRHY